MNSSSDLRHDHLEEVNGQHSAANASDREVHSQQSQLPSRTIQWQAIAITKTKRTVNADCPKCNFVASVKPLTTVNREAGFSV